MNRRDALLTATLVTASVVVAVAQRGQAPGPLRTPGVGAAQDPNRAAFVAANCTNPPLPPRTDAAAGGPAWFGPPIDVTTTAIPGVVASGQKWKLLFEDSDTQADGLISLSDGSILFTEDRKNRVMRLDQDGRVSVLHQETHMSGALAVNGRGQLFVAERALDRSITLLEPQRRPFANTMNGAPLECLGPAGLNDLAADSRGGVYFTMGGVFYANPQGVVSGPYGTIPGNGLVLSPDEKTLYVTGRLRGATPPANIAGAGGVVAFDVRADGSVANERQFSWVGGDGLTVDNQGRLYTSFPPGGTPKGDNSLPFEKLQLGPEYRPAVTVLSPRGELLGTIPTPRTLVQITIGGRDNKTLYGLAIRDVRLYSIPVIAEGLKGRSH